MSFSFLFLSFFIFHCLKLPNYCSYLTIDSLHLDEWTCLLVSTHCFKISTVRYSSFRNKYTKSCFSSLWRQCFWPFIYHFFSSVRGVLSGLRYPWRVHGRGLSLRGRLDGRWLRPACLQPTLHQARNLQGRKVPVSPGLERRALHHRWAPLVCTWGDVCV